MQSLLERAGHKQVDLTQVVLWRGNTAWVFTALGDYVRLGLHCPSTTTKCPQSSTRGNSDGSNLPRAERSRTNEKVTALAGTKSASPPATDKVPARSGETTS